MGNPIARYFRSRLITLCFLALALFAGWSAYLYIAAPVESLRGVVTYTPPFKSYTRQVGLGLPDNLTLRQMPVDLILATLVGEDEVFPAHYGVNPPKIYAYGVKYLLHGGHLSGCSTLTQQLVKNIFTGPERSLYRKYVELIYAFKIERHFTKEEIFTLYANVAQTGPDTYGYKEAARYYFGKEALQLTPVESAFIVSNLPSPQRRTTWFRKGTPDPDAFGRGAFILRHMLLLKAEFTGADDISDDEKASFFTGYMSAPGRKVCMTDVVPVAIWDYTGPEMRRFLHAYGNDSVRTVNAPDTP